MILVTGASGTVGSYMTEALFGEPLLKTDVDTLDILKPAALSAFFSANKGKISVVVHLAAMTDVGRCDLEPHKAYLLNAVGTQNVALACMKAGVPLCYVSTLEVFGGDGKPGPFNEYSDVSPANEYGRSKLAGEHAVRDLLSQFYIVRTAWVMGGGEKDNKFTGKIIAKIKKGEKLIHAVEDIYGSPTYAKNLVENLAILLKSGLFGVYHMTNTGSCSRFELALELVRLLGRPAAVLPVKADHFNLPSGRKSSEVSQNLHLELRGMNRMPSWSEALKEYVGELKEKGVV